MSYTVHKLKLKAKKCRLLQTEVIFLGKLVSRDGTCISPNPDSVSAVQDWPWPVSSKEVERFLGFINYHNAHVQVFAKLACPLYGLTKKNVQFVWTDEHDTAFQALKYKLTSSPLLTFPRNDSNSVFVLDTDASDTAIGAELLQMQDSVEKVIGYGSYVLSPEQRKYCPARKELLAVVRFTRQLRQLLTGAPILHLNGPQ